MTIDTLTSIRYIRGITAAFGAIPRIKRALIGRRETGTAEVLPPDWSS